MSKIRSAFEWRQLEREVIHSNAACGTYLSLSEPVVHSVHEPGGTHDIAHARCKFCATLWGQGLRQIDYLEVRPLNCPSEAV